MGDIEIYYKNSRPELHRYIQIGQNRILELGCAEGLLGESLKRKGLASEVVGIELVPGAANAAEQRLDRVICGDIELLDHEELGLDVGYFDYIICADVLEHLRNPWSVINWLVTLLKPGGLLVASIPNVRHWSVLLPLAFKGIWQYRSCGILDQTHLRFFTRKTSIQLLEDSGLQVVSCDGSPLRRKMNWLIHFLLLGMGRGFVSEQWILVGEKCVEVDI